VMIFSLLIPPAPAFSACMLNVSSQNPRMGRFYFYQQPKALERSASIHQNARWASYNTAALLCESQQYCPHATEKHTATRAPGSAAPRCKSPAAPPDLPHYHQLPAIRPPWHCDTLHDSRPPPDCPPKGCSLNEKSIDTNWAPSRTATAALSYQNFDFGYHEKTFPTHTNAPEPRSQARQADAPSTPPENAETYWLKP